MMDDVEQIEAKLCAYVDGQLTGREREEIEQHLEANPSHRALLRDLMAQAKMLRQLPRESAPADLADPIQVQLEREALLGHELFEESGTNLQVIRWPQYLAVAAILMLALGLGVIVYLVLPPKHPMLTMAPQPEPLREQTEAGVVGQPMESLAAAGRMAEGGQTRGDIQGDVPAIMRRGDGGVGSAGTSTDPMAGTLMVMDDRTGANGAITVHTAAFFRESPSNETLVITVKAADVQVVNAEVVKYLSENKIAWSAAESQLVSLTEGPVPAVPAQGSAGIDQPSLAAGSDERNQPALGGAPSADAVVTAGVAAKGRSDRKLDEPGQSRGVAQNALAEQLAQLVRRNRMLAGDASIQSVMLAKDNLRFTRGERVILAKDVSSHQLTELRTTLSQSTGGNQDRPTPAVAFYYAKAEPVQARFAKLPAERGDAAPSTQPSTNPVVAMGVDLGRSAAELQPVATRPALFPATLPTTRPAVAALSSPVPVTFELAATQPTAVAGSFNCVIVLEDTDHPAPASQPVGEARPLPATMPSVPATNPASAEQVQ